MINVCIVHECSIVKNVDVSTDGGVPMDSYLLIDMPFVEDVNSIINSLQGLQHFDSP